MKIYEDKIYFDEIDDREKHYRESLPEFIYSRYTRTFGMKEIAEKKLLDFFESLRAYKDNRFVDLFRRFCGVVEDQKMLLGMDGLNIFL